MKTIIITMVCLCFAYSGAYAQEDIKAEKYENPQWYWVVKVDFAPGKINRAKEIIENYFMKAGADAGVPGPAMVMEMSSGEYDMVFVWHMKDGIEGMNWKTSPEDVKWLSSMSKIAGDQEKAQALWEEYESYIVKSDADLARKVW
ncbi:hypothetical protein [Robertkochia flava]|uniref:hypothetical protein n=1 Tax=Robertkochia flava TaxID=3447986 RepID=UPI001CCA5345|nr:hypothetical protein [Robertkochia marina]